MRFDVGSPARRALPERAGALRESPPRLSCHDRPAVPSAPCRRRVFTGVPAKASAVTSVRWPDSR